MRMNVGIFAASRRRKISGEPVVPVTTAVIALIGQSNMVGRNGPIDGVLDATDPNILMLSGSSLVTAADPLDHFDETADTVGPGLSLAKRYMELNPSVARVILVPAADGGTGHLSANWNRNDVLYADAVARINTAMDEAIATYGSATLVAVCQIQGENEIDGADGAAMDQAEFRAVKAMFARDFRTDLADADASTPIVFGGLSPDWTPAFGTTVAEINSVQAGLGTYVTKYAYADPTTPTSLPGASGDEVHYTAAACRAMGVRMAEAISAAAASSTILPTPPAAPPGTHFFHFDHTGIGDGFPLTENSGNDVKFSNRRVTLIDGEMVFSTSARTINRRLHFLRDAFTPLTDQDFVLQVTFTPDSVVGNQGIVGLWNVFGDNRSWLLRTSGTSVQFFYSRDGTEALFLEATGAASVGVEVSIEVRRDGGELVLWKDGVPIDSTVIGTDSFFDVVDADIGVTVGDYDNTYGTNTNHSANPYSGTIKRLTLSQLAGATVAQPFVAALYGFDGAGYLDDESGRGHDLTAAGAAFGFVSGGGRFDDAAGAISTGSNAYATAPHSDDFILGGQFTIEGWAKKPSNVGATQPIISKYNTLANNRGWALFWTSGDLRATLSLDGTAVDLGITSSTTPSTGAWHHFALDRDAEGTVRLYIDGVMVGSGTLIGGIHQNPSTPLSINAINGANDADNGHQVDEIRITNGAALYASDSGFTVPASKFPRP